MAQELKDYDIMDIEAMDDELENQQPPKRQRNNKMAEEKKQRKNRK